MAKKILSVVAGLIVHTIFVFLLEMIGHLIFPHPEGMENIMNLPKEEMQVMMDSLDVGSFIIMVVGWGLGAMLGAAVASKILPSYWKTSSFVIGVIVALMVLLMTFAIPHPTWVVVVGLIIPIPMAYVGGKMFGTEE